MKDEKPVVVDRKRIPKVTPPKQAILLWISQWPEEHKPELPPVPRDEV